MSLSGRRWAHVAIACISAHACSTREPPAPGRSGVIELEERRLGFEMGGRILEVFVADGQRVEAGRPLIRLDDTLDRAQRPALEADLARASAQADLLVAGARATEVRAARAQLSAARSQVEAAEREYARREALLRGGNVAQAIVDTAKTQVDEARASRDAAAERLRTLEEGSRREDIRAASATRDRAGAALAALDERLRRFVLSAPTEGTILDVLVDEGEIVGPGTPCAVFAEPKQPYVVIFVPAAELASVRVGQRATVRPDGDEESYQGRVEHISKTVEYTPRYLLSEGDRAALVTRVRVRIDDPNERLHAGVPSRVLLREIETR